MEEMATNNGPGSSFPRREGRHLLSAVARQHRGTSPVRNRSHWELDTLMHSVHQWTAEVRGLLEGVFQQEL
jgi:hypothetical protein